MEEVQFFVSLENVKSKFLSHLNFMNKKNNKKQIHAACAVVDIIMNEWYTLHLQQPNMIWNGIEMIILFML